MVDMHLEVDIIPVSDVERSKQFYGRLGWRLDDDVAPAKDVCIVQFTPPGLLLFHHVRQWNNVGRPWLVHGDARCRRHWCGP